MAGPDEQGGGIKDFEVLEQSPLTKQDQQIDELQKQLIGERDARREDRFVFIVVVVLLLDVVFFSIMPSFGGPIALLILELLVLVPLAQRMGMEEISQLLSRVLDRITSKGKGEE